MTDLPDGLIVASSPVGLASVNPPPQYLAIGNVVRISLDTGILEYGDGYTPDGAARTFWEAMGAAYSGPEAVFGHGLAARVDAEMSELRRQIATVRALHQQYRDVEAIGDNDSCAHCNQITSCRVPWPCPTIQALEAPMRVGTSAGTSNEPGPEVGTCGPDCASSHMYDGRCVVDPRLDGIIAYSRENGCVTWAWRCEDAPGCDGMISLGHGSGAEARRAYDRHCAREHEPASVAGPAAGEVQR